MPTMKMRHEKVAVMIFALVEFSAGTGSQL
jgi:hypothetical protein